MKSLKSIIGRYILPPITALTFTLTPMSAIAQERSFWNLPTGIVKGVVGGVAQIVYTGPKNVIEKTSEKGIFAGAGAIGDWIGRPVVKAANEVGYGLDFKDSGVGPEDIGNWNREIEKIPEARIIRNGGAAFAGAYGLGTWQSVYESAQAAGWWAAGGAAAGTLADEATK